MPNLIAQTLSSVTLGAPITCDAITMLPLVATKVFEKEPFYLTLDEALSTGVAEITEISAQGSVPELLVVNRGAKPVLILDGEELVGAKQNRVVNLTILVPAQAKVTIPVSCVEAGRWRARSRAFSSAPRTQYAAGRARRMRQVTESMQFSGARHSDQAAVWADIAEKSARMGADSPSGAMEEIFLRHGEFADRCVETLRAVPRQAGALFLLDGRVVGFDLFDRASTLRRLLPKLVRSVAMDAVDKGMGVGDSDHPRRPDLQVGLEPAPDRRGANDPRRPDVYVGRQVTDRRRPDLEVGRGTARRVSPDLLVKVAEHFLNRTCAADVHEDDAVGMGRDLRLSAPTLSGAALVADAAVVHLSAFHV